jgi:hypothetical protein
MLIWVKHGLELTNRVFLCGQHSPEETLIVSKRRFDVTLRIRPRGERRVGENIPKQDGVKRIKQCVIVVILIKDEVQCFLKRAICDAPHSICELIARLAVKPSRAFS